MPGKTGFDLNGASQSFNVLAEYLFGKVIRIFCEAGAFLSTTISFNLLIQMFGAFRIQIRRKWR